ncbi:hypothetical protein HanRHA438_Chr09g0399741 [Helianthus annuus]|nr:hypothetical protein HanRHA438_Chr09g0399741 [Helianthus annuus]
MIFALIYKTFIENPIPDTCTSDARHNCIALHVPVMHVIVISIRIVAFVQ